MAGESILVVDDEPVNLKLADILLRKEGYKIYTAPHAEQALQVLRGLVPDVILADISLPGMDGLEFTRQVRRDVRTRDVTVIVLTAFSSKGDRERAAEAGCDGYITKPIETLTLAKRIREVLARKAPPAAVVTSAPAPARAPGLMNGLDLSTPELEGVRRHFLEEGILQSRQLLMDLGARFDAAKARGLTHRWVGAAGALGYTEISAYSRMVEDLLSAPRLDLAALREQLSSLTLAFSDPREAAPDSIPESVAATLLGKRIAMVGFAAEEAERLCTVFERLGVRPCLFPPHEPPDSKAIRLCHAVMVHVREETLAAPWFDPERFSACGAALVFVGTREHILELCPAVQDRAKEFLIDTWQPEEALMRLSFALRRDAAPEPERSSPVRSMASKQAVALARRGVIVADDDIAMRTSLKKTLAGHHFDCRTATGGREALLMIDQCLPAAVVLDVNMPDMNGFQVLAAIREQSIPVRVVMLTASQQEHDVVQSFVLGADDYLSKPFRSMELVMRLNRLMRG
jgi:CheY-like chemotaxis protein/HPt (histidine-containing phosphotransfer) domain-containing protein